MIANVATAVTNGGIHEHHGSVEMDDFSGRWVLFDIRQRQLLSRCLGFEVLGGDPGTDLGRRGDVDALRWQDDGVTVLAIDCTTSGDAQAGEISLGNSAADLANGDGLIADVDGEARHGGRCFVCGWVVGEIQVGGSSRIQARTLLVLCFGMVVG